MADELDVIDILDEAQADTENLDAEEHEGEQETIVTFGEEVAPTSPEPETALLKHLRATARDQAKELAQLRKSIPKPELGAMPDYFDDCDADPASFATAMEAWLKRKAEFDKDQSDEIAAQDAVKKRNQDKFDTYQAGIAQLNVPDYADAQSVVEMALPHNAQSAIIEAVDNPAAFIYAISKSPEKLAELAKIDDPIKLLKAVWKLEGTMKVTTRRKGVALEQIERGGVPVQIGADKQQARLEAEAEKTGNYTELFAHNRAKRSRK